MKKINLLFIALLFPLFASQAQNRMILHVDEAEETINREIYGHFAEHLGRCIYDGLYVGEDSEIENIKGYRKDIIEALKEMQIPLLRWPGGCFADTYHWKDGIGPRASRPSIVNIHWGGVTEDNSFGTHEFLEFCELINAEPYVNLNVGSGTVQEASEWVEYITSSNQSPMTDLRKQNGRNEPWKVKYFGIGNENWGCGGNMTPEYYADLYRRFASYCGGAEFKIAGGPNVDDYNWTEVMMRKLQNHMFLMQGLSLHYYTIPQDWPPRFSATDFDKADWQETMFQVHRMEELIEKHSTIMDKYDPDKNVGLMVDEWGTWFAPMEGTNPGFLHQQNTLRDALVAGIGLNIFNNHADRVKMANIAQMVNVLQAVILTKGQELVLTPTYHVFKMYAAHQDAKLVPFHLSAEDYTINNQTLPSISTSASVKDGVLNVTMCNSNPDKDIEIEYDVRGASFSQAKGEILTAKSITDYNDFGGKNTVYTTDFKVNKPKNGKVKIKIPAKSVVLVQLSNSKGA
ncbi:alpha-N-arabinofuranosidase [Persicobacter diffluens]|uniref:non-reducing end alpha-L-arabinofuranosidase n=1 Tax=Persicobacter diffluens TaxID=981 RepID=A0AAN4W3Y4_9BACT|nr:intracellular exo-alpha-L-arabinofuranosidase 2 [Persicobacter diffluens]